MRVAIVHDWLVTYGGAERVLKALLDIFPEATLYSLIDFLPRNVLGKKAKTTFLQKIPFSKKCYPYFLPWMPYAIESLDLRGYDLVISSSYAVAKGVITTPLQKHFCYCHTPLRYLWDQQEHHPLTRSFIGQFLLHRLRNWDVVSAGRVDHFIANSAFVASRIEKYYRRESQVVHPPIAVEKFKLVEKKEDFYLHVGRIVPYKRVDLIVEAFSMMPEKKLVIVGKGSIKKMGSNITVLGHQSDEVVAELMGKAKGFVYAGVEDFGIAPLEAGASGCPVIAYARGGLLETITHESGHFFYEQSARSIVEAILEFEKREIDPKRCRANALRFSEEHFREKIKKIILGDTNESGDISWRKWNQAVAYVKEPIPEAIS